MLKDEEVTTFEKIEEPLWVGFGYYSNWPAGTWYHVHSSKGTGWINKGYAEPESAVPVHWKVALKDQYELERYPGVPFTGSTLLLRQQTVEAAEAWDDPSGIKWLRVSVDGRTGWISPSYGEQLRIWDEDANTAIQVLPGTILGVGIVKDIEGKLKVFNEKKIGYTEDGTHYLEAGLLANELRFEAVKVPYADAVTYSQGDYSFMLESAFAPPRCIGTAPYSASPN
ncbi:hypothetical protein GCM10008018_21640 [Paenibacillus marchantiophytorum]|uniref:Uncharacterized protein n=1 Tax=Paenibacillus marchantiophytorum TaxID=1619310 RepID=A0ABQ1EKX0_9BACL|nr:hypothetical protein [Paenibacillus marchantiophytorum]GFZ75950.1 hypothetical protein GCM10008018_21640 [Paenibacillus marchantiophytorum]